MLWATNAYAMGGGSGGESGMMSIIPLILMFAVFYFLLIRPQQKRAKQHQAMLDSVKRGDEIVTSGGIYGRVLEVAETYLTVDLGDTKVKMSRNSVAAIVGAPKTDKAEKAEKPARKSGKSGDKAKAEKADAAAAKEEKDERA